MGEPAVTEKLRATRLAEYHGAETAAVYSGPGGEFSALRRGCGVYHLNWRARILLSGGDRVRWLNGMITNNVRDLPASQGMYAFLLNPQGHIQADLYAYNRGDSLLVDTDQFQVAKVLGIFDHYIIMDDVEVNNLSEKQIALAVAGPGSRSVLRSTGLEVPRLDPLQLVDLSWQGAGVTVIRSDQPVIDCYELWLSPANLNSLWESLLKSGATPVGCEAVELMRIALGVPAYGQDIRERDLPQETEQSRALHFTKGCYIGQEIVERIRSRGSVHRKFTGFTIEGPLPTPGTRVQVEGKEAGEITSIASLPVPDGDFTAALGYMRREHARPGKAVQIGDASAKLSDLPFLKVIETEG